MNHTFMIGKIEVIVHIIDMKTYLEDIGGKILVNV